MAGVASADDVAEGRPAPDPVSGAKVVAGFLSGSPALLSEVAHFVADSMNEAFVLAALRRSRRLADPQHLFGYGKDLRLVTGQAVWEASASQGSNLICAVSVHGPRGGAHLEGNDRPARHRTRRRRRRPARTG
ncbi:hypothetical protein CG723_22440 [Streptomyces sp. CB01635]|nr:hypothetical protein CG723_22440 [Streptomyces sp. CB01635]